jgi:phosphatidylserine decarboxylase
MTEQRWPVAREGLPFLIPSALLALLFAGLGWGILTGVAILLTLFIVFFFRNPERRIPDDKNAILSPADGTIIHLGQCEEERFLKEKALKVSIFMSVFDVHLNRAPVSGTLIAENYNRGRFFVASADKASLLNEQKALVLETEDRFKVLLVQIAGFIARRIVCYPRAGDRLKQGEIFGLIRFGSRVDLYLPPTVKPNVRVGERVKGGESIIGYWT